MVILPKEWLQRYMINLIIVYHKMHISSVWKYIFQKLQAPIPLLCLCFSYDINRTIVLGW